MSYEVKNATLRKDGPDGKFELVDPKEYFKDKEVLVAIDGDTLITIQLLINSIIKNDFKKWEKINDSGSSEPASHLFVKLGYSKQELARLIEDLD